MSAYKIGPRSHPNASWKSSTTHKPPPASDRAIGGGTVGLTCIGAGGAWLHFDVLSTTVTLLLSYSAPSTIQQQARSLVSRVVSEISASASASLNPNSNFNFNISIGSKVEASAVAIWRENLGSRSPSRMSGIKHECTRSKITTKDTQNANACLRSRGNKRIHSPCWPPIPSSPNPKPNFCAYVCVRRCIIPSAARRSGKPP